MNKGKRSPARQAAMRNSRKTTDNKAKVHPNGTGSAVLSNILPFPERRFHGRIGTLYTDSEPEIRELQAPPEGAPNVLLILLDDVGFGHTSTFGGPVHTPTSNAWQTEDSVITASIQQHCAHRRVLRF